MQSPLPLLQPSPSPLHRATSMTFTIQLCHVHIVLIFAVFHSKHMKGLSFGYLEHILFVLNVENILLPYICVNVLL